MTESTETFRSKVISGLSWSTLGTVTTQATSILTFVILGRYFLDPSDFGLVAMIMVLTGFASLFTEFGLGAALIQKQDADESHKSSIFWLSIILGVSVYLLFLFLRSTIAAFYERPILYNLVSPLALTLVIAAASSVHVSLLRKEMRFKSLTLASVFADIVSLIAAVVTASYGVGLWALVVKVLVLRLLFSLTIFYIYPWRPKFSFSLRAIKDIFNFGLSYFGARTFSYTAVKIDELMIGKFIGDSGLGLYSNAFKIVLAPIGLIKNQVVGVFFPALSSIQNDKPKTKIIALQLSGLLAMIGFPILFYITISAQDWIVLLLDDDWLDMELILVLLSFIAMLEISIFPGVIFLSQGRADSYFRLMLWTKSLTSFGIIIGVLTNGITGLLIGMLLAAMLNFLPYMFFSGRLIGLKVTEQLLVNIVPFLAAATAACLIILGEPWLITGTASWSSLLIKTVLFFGTIGISYYAFKPYPLKLLSRWVFPTRNST